jgi:hypothetical protein
VGHFGGFTPASRRLVALPDGPRAFAKGATNDLTEGWLLAEHHVYTHLRGSFMPRLLGWDDSEVVLSWACRLLGIEPPDGNSTPRRRV